MRCRAFATRSCGAINRDVPRCCALRLHGAALQGAVQWAYDESQSNEGQTMKFIFKLIVLLILVVIAAGAWVWSGQYYIGADSPHWQLTRQAIDTLRERSIETRAEKIRVPDLDDPALLSEGAEHYAEMCTGCHLAPGMDESELRKGLYPQATQSHPLRPRARRGLLGHQARHQDERNACLGQDPQRPEDLGHGRLSAEAADPDSGPLSAACRANG